MNLVHVCCESCEKYVTYVNIVHESCEKCVTYVNIVMKVVKSV